LYFSYNMTLKSVAKLSERSTFKKVKFYQLLIKLLIKQDIVMTSNFWNLFKNYLVLMDLLPKSFVSKYSHLPKSVEYSRNILHKTDNLKLTSSIHLLKVNYFDADKGPESLILFKLYLKLAYSQPFFNAKQHFSYRLLFNNFHPNEVVHLDLGKAFSRWFSTHSLLINLFYYSIRLVTFGTKLLRDEILALNSRTSPINILNNNTFTKSFFFSSATTGPTFATGFRRLNSSKVENAFILDLDFHRRTTFFLKRNNIFTLGLVPASQDPWVVDHPIPTFSSTTLTQYYFIKLFTYTFSVGKSAYFMNVKSLWFKLLF